MADPIISDQEIAEIALQPASVETDAGVVRMRSLNEILAVRALTETRKRLPLGGAVIARCIMPASIGPVPDTE